MTAEQIIALFQMKPPREGGEFAFMRTTVAPGFEFEDCEQGDRAQLIEQYPHQRDLITRLSRNA